MAKKEKTKVKTKKKRKGDIDKGPNLVSGKKKGKKKGGEIYFSKVSPLDIAMSIRHLALMLKAGMPIADALVILQEQSSDKRLGRAFEDLADQVNSGTTLAEAMRAHPKIFTKVVASVIDVGEQGATLETNLIFLAQFLKADYELQRKIKGALAYPMIIFGITVAEMMGVIFYILPKLDTLFSSFDNVPAFTQFLMDLSGFLRENAVMAVVVTVVFVIIYKIFMKSKAGVKVKEYFSLHFPVVKEITKKNTLTTFSRTLGILLESGLPIVKAIEISSETIGHGTYSRALIDVAKSVKEGNNLSSSLDKYPDLFPKTYTKMIEIGEETGSLEDNLLYLHEFYTEEVKDMAENLTTLLEPILLVFIGAMIGLLALSVVSPIYQLTGSING
jgi:type IV pilus assembly protein PilC